MPFINGTVTMTRFAVRGAICCAAWCGYNEKRFAVSGTVRGVAKRKSGYNVAATAKRRRCAICRAAEVFTIKAASQEMRPRGDHITFLKTGHGY